VPIVTPSCRPVFDSGVDVSETARMIEQGLANGLPQRAAVAVGLLTKIIDDQTAKARDRLNAVQILKRFLLGIERRLRAQDMSPEVRKDIIDILRKYRRA
jgi:hypothetical protein